MAPTLAASPFPPRQLVTDPAELLTYEIDAGLDRGMPDAVFYPDTAEDVRRLVGWAAGKGWPVVVRGAGTGLAGGAVAERGGVVVVPSRMNRILALDAENRTAHVEAGAVNQQVEAAVTAEGLYYPPDPSSGRSACIGGNLGTNAGGPHCFKYGVTTNYVTALDVVLADGRALSLGGPAADAPGYDLCGLVVGSEGTLALATHAHLRIVRRPPGVRTMMVSFPSLEAAGDAVSAVIAAGLVPATLEVIDRPAMGMIEAYCQVGLPVHAGAALIVEVDGYPESLVGQMDEITALLLRHGAGDVRVATSEAERQRIWYGRKSAAGAIARLAPSFYLTDVTVRRSLLAEVLAGVAAICERHDLQTASFFHAGDGNLHPLILCDPRDEAWMRRVHAAVGEIIDLCVERDGSITGEHGVGIEKRAFMPRMCSGAELSAMLDVKRVFDPEGLLNPGKIFPDNLPAPALAEPRLPEGDVFTPASAEEAAAGLRALGEAGRSARPGGAWQSDPAPADVWLSTAALTGVRDFAPEDLFLTAGAGTPLAEVQAFLAGHGLQLPLAAPEADATLGGIVSANRNAPLRLRYGGVRDLLLGATVALADGRVFRAGRPLVKNVAGYDLPKVFVGAHGTLGLLADVTFKLTPRPRARRTLVARTGTPAGAFDAARRTLRLALVGAGLVAEGDGEGWSVRYTMEGLPAEVDAETEAVETALTALGLAPSIEESDATAAWARFLRAAPADALAIRAGVPLRELEAFVREAFPPDLPVLADAAFGLVYAALPASDPEAAVRRLAAVRREAEQRGGYAVATTVPAALAGRLDPWGRRPEAFDLMRALKHCWDPAGVLNPGSCEIRSAKGEGRNP